MKKLSVVLTLFILVACKPSELERCIEANIENNNDDEKVHLELGEKIKKAVPDLNFFQDYSSSLQLTYGLSPLVWEDGLPFNKDKAIKIAGELYKTYVKKTGSNELCFVYDFKSMESFYECNENIESGLSQDEKEEFQKITLDLMKAELRGSDRKYQEHMVLEHYYNNHLYDIENENDLPLSFIKNPTKWTINDMVLIIGETLNGLDFFKNTSSSYDEDEHLKEYYQVQVQFAENLLQKQLNQIKKSIEAAKPKLAKSMCNSQGIY